MSGAELHPPVPVQEIAARLEAAGHETWCVGGAVRDALLGHPHLDWDLATAARPEEVRRLFRRTVPVGVEFGTVGVIDRQGTMHEVTTFRRDVKTDGRHAVVEFGASLEDDLARRDLTINAIAYSPARRELRDPFGGREDLSRRVIRAVGDPDARMREDRLRALRAIRFAARFEFEIEAATWRAIAGSAPQLGRLSAERVKQELEKTMDQLPRPSQAIALWVRSGAMATLIPALAAIDEVTLGSLDELPRPRLTTRPGRRIARLGALFAAVAPPDASQLLRALRFSNQEARWIGDVLERWRVIAPELETRLRSGSAVTDAEIRRWVARTGRTMLAPVLRLAAARFAAARRLGQPAPTAAVMASLYRRAVRIAFRDAVEVGDLALDGDDLRAAGIPAGPLLGRILQELLRLVIENPSLNRAEALTEAALELRRARDGADEE